MLENIHIRPARHEDIASITRIYNEGIASGQGTFETQLRNEKDIASWLEASGRYPVLVVELAGFIVGFARLFEYRPRACYAGIAEFSIYLADEGKGKGIGTQLLSELLITARTQGFHKVLSRIFTFNAASRALCKKLGFREVGVYERHGQLKGEWLDVVIVEYLISDAIADNRKKVE